MIIHTDVALLSGQQQISKATYEGLDENSSERNGEPNARIKLCNRSAVDKDVLGGRLRSRANLDVGLYV